MKYHQKNYNWYNELSAVSQYKCLYLDLHGLIFETSICYWQDQPGILPWQVKDPVPSQKRLWWKRTTLSSYILRVVMQDDRVYPFMKWILITWLSSSTKYWIKQVYNQRTATFHPHSNITTRDQNLGCEMTSMNPTKLTHHCRLSSRSWSACNDVQTGTWIWTQLQGNLRMHDFSFAKRFGETQ